MPPQPSSPSRLMEGQSHHQSVRRMTPLPLPRRSSPAESMLAPSSLGRPDRRKQRRRRRLSSLVPLFPVKAALATSLPTQPLLRLEMMWPVDLLLLQSPCRLLLQLPKESPIRSCPPQCRRKL